MFLPGHLRTSLDLARSDCRREKNCCQWDQKKPPKKSRTWDICLTPPPAERKTQQENVNIKKIKKKQFQEERRRERSQTPRECRPPAAPYDKLGDGRCQDARLEPKRHLPYTHCAMNVLIISLHQIMNHAAVQNVLIQPCLAWINGW